MVDINNKLYYIKKPETLCSTSFLWSPKTTVPAGNLEEVCTINTLHTYGYYGLFKPTVEEVLSQIPHCVVDEVIAFEVDGPKDANDLNKHKVELNEGFHVARTTFYKQREE